MRFNGILRKDLEHYRKKNLSVALGMAVGAAVITGALVTGDSVRSGLIGLTHSRLGNIDLVADAGDRFFTDTLAGRISARLGIPAAAVLQLEGPVAAGGGTTRLPKVTVSGVDRSFAAVLGPGAFPMPGGDTAVLSDNLAERLGAGIGDEIILRIPRPGPVPAEAPFVSEEARITSVTLTVGHIATQQEFGRYHLGNTQEAPLNLFVSRDLLQRSAELRGRANLILLAGNGQADAARLKDAMAKARSLEDAGIDLRKSPLNGQWILRTPRVFFDPPAFETIRTAFPDADARFTYFVNSFETNGKSTPYSFVSTLPDGQIKPGETVINSWLADDLDAKPGDTVRMSYFKVGPMRALTEESATFRIIRIIEADDPRNDRQLMPEIPGLSDAGSCRDWEAGIPINLEKIRDKDEDYWNRFRGTPKAYIDQETAVRLWQNRFGSHTQVRLKESADRSAVEQAILGLLDPAGSGITLREPVREGMSAAGSGVNFSGLFTGLSFFLIVSGIILAVLLTGMNLESRSGTFRVLQALGWSRRRISTLHLAELAWIAVIGTLIGITLGFIYTGLVFKALNGVWNGMVMTDHLRPVFRPVTLAAGAAVSLSVSLGSAWFALRRFFRKQERRGSSQTYAGSGRRISGYRTASITAIVLSAGLLAFGTIGRETPGQIEYFLGGTLLMASFLLLLPAFLLRQESRSGSILNTRSLVLSGLRRHPGRTLPVIILFATGVFLVMAIGSNRKIAPGTAGEQEHSDGTGGFGYFIETTVPVSGSLNDPGVRATYGLEVPARFVQMKRLPGDDASCLNLNRVSRPPLLSVGRGMLDGRFSFQELSDPDFRDRPWDLLEEPAGEGIIRAFADGNVIRWGLGLKVGDTLRYAAENGDSIRVVLSGALAGSVFQGHLLVSADAFSRNWPTVGGSPVLLAETADENKSGFETEMRSVFRDHGISLEYAAERLARFNAVENTYLSVFLALGSLAVLLGTIGLAVILLRNLQERRHELAILRASGFPVGRIFGLVTGEYSLLLVAGIAGGGLPALVASLPVMLMPSGGLSPLYLASIPLVLIGFGWLWVVTFSWQAVNRRDILNGLRSE